MRIVTSPAFSSWSDDVASLPRLITEGKGSLLYNGRNKVWLFRHGNDMYTVKQYHRLGFFKSVIYTFFRKNKARRAYENGLRLTANGVLTPVPIALIEERRHSLLSTVYYVCGYTDWQAIRGPLTEEKPFNRQMTIDYASFVASLHRKGIIHKDLNNTNVLYHLRSGHYDFMLIDINRMSFTADGSAAGDDACLENLTLFADRGEMFDMFAAEYVKARGWDSSRIADVFPAKARHDRHWHRKQRLKAMFRKRRKVGSKPPVLERDTI